MKYEDTPTKGVVIVGMVGGAALLVIGYLQGDTFGFPGSEAYQKYEFYNRAFSIGLLLASFAYLGIYQRYANILPKSGKTIYTLTLISLIGIIFGNAAEFWLFSNLPYQQLNMRSISFTIFALGLLLLGVVSLIGGILFLKNKEIPLLAGVLLVAYFPLIFLMANIASDFAGLGLPALGLGKIGRAHV